MTAHFRSRRKFIRQSVYSVTAIAGTLFTFSRCQPKSNSQKEQKAAPTVTSCDDYSGLSEEDLKVRENLGYEEKSPIDDRQCHNCNLYLPPEGDSPCGGCVLFKGPVYPEAYCTYWAPQE